MTTLITDLLDVDALHRELRDGYVRLRWHPTTPLAIFNYAEKAQFERRWNDVTRQCRGLIVDTETNEVLARPFDKFFNYGEPEAASIDPFAIVEVTDKMDGSLGILYPAPNGWAVATRGSLTSDQAVVGTEILQEYLAADEVFAAWLDSVGRRWTLLAEIIYPENRIVLDYGDARALSLLGARNIATGRILGPADVWYWPGPRAEVLDTAISSQAAYTDLQGLERPNAEGVVIRDLVSGGMVKIKQEDYVRLHKLVTGLNERVVWEHLSTHGGSYDELLAEVPDEFHAWVREVAEGLLEQHETIQGRAHAAYQEVSHHMFALYGEEDVFERKAFAAWAFDNHHDLASYLFQLLDGRDISPAIWKTLKPRGDSQSLLNRTEDNA